MTNIIKQALSDKLQSIENLSDALTDKRIDFLETRAKELLHPAFEFLPDANVKAGYDTFYIYASLDRRSEILSINKRTFGTAYLNTYSTFIDSESEYKRLIFNGKVAELFLNDSELFDKLFAPTEFDEELNSLRDEAWTLRREVDKLEQIEAATLRNERITKFFNGEEIEFEEAKSVSYGYRKYDQISRVKKIRCVSFNKSKKKVTVEFTCKSWDDETPDRVVTYENLAMKYMEYYI